MNFTIRLFIFLFFFDLIQLYFSKCTIQWTCSRIFTSSWHSSTLGVSGVNYLSSVGWNQFDKYSVKWSGPGIYYYYLAFLFPVPLLPPFLGWFIYLKGRVKHREEQTQKNLLRTGSVLKWPQWQGGPKQNWRS